MHALTNALKIINAFFANIVPIGDILWTFPQNFSWYANIPIIGSIPFAIYLLLGMGIYFSIRTKFVQFRYFKRGIQVLTKKKKDTTGVSPLAAFMLSAAMRVGPGNIIGVTGAFFRRSRGNVLDVDFCITWNGKLLRRSNPCTDI